MKRILINFIRLFLPDKVYRKWKRKYQISKTRPMSIIEHPDECFERLYHIKDETWETTQMAEVFNTAKQTTVKVHHPKQDILLVEDARVVADSDIVITPKGVLWDKYYTYNFDISIVPWDIDYTFIDGQRRINRTTKHTEFIEGGCVSLLGVFVPVWAHFMMQFLCKMYYAEEAGLFNQPCTLLVPSDLDANMKELVDNELRKYQDLKCVVAQKDIEYICQKLFYIQTTSVYHNQSIILHHGQVVIPQRVVDTIQNKVVKPYLKKIKPNNKYEKVFLIRRNTTRSLVNNDEVEEYFKNEGFYFMEGADYSLQDKAEIFHNAKIIVGPQGTAFTNTIFCEEAKCLVFVNAWHVMENSLFTLSYPHVKRCIHVTGDDESTHFNSKVYIPLDKVIKAYKELLKDE